MADVPYSTASDVNVSYEFYDDNERHADVTNVSLDANNTSNETQPITFLKPEENEFSFALNGVLSPPIILLTS